ncbi:unnamed protein product, partial [Vitis vinifera]
MVVERDIDDLPKNAANYTALTPLWFLERAAVVHPNRKSVIHGSLQYTWLQTYQRCRRLASALSKYSIGAGSTVAIIAPNIPAMYEAHFGVPMSGAVVNCVNIRLNAPTIAFLLEHSSAAVVMVDQEFFPLAEEALKIWSGKSKNDFKPPLLIVIADESCDPKGLEYALRKGVIEYEQFLETGDPEFAWKPPQDEWQSIALGYTSGTTASPKGVVLHHRGAYVMALSGALVWGMNEGAVYLWTLPMFHCNGWCFTWTLAALCGTNICLRQVATKAIYQAIANDGVTHLCAAPVVLNSIVNAPKSETILPLPRVVHPVPADGTTIGEIVMRGNTVMKGYLKNPKANEETFANGWFHSGDLGVKHPDGYIQLKDRSKDIIISGGENISSVEIENAVYLHPAVLEASVVARPDDRWGESPCAFVTLKPGVDRITNQKKKKKLGTWKPTKNDTRAKRIPGFGATMNVLYGDSVCGQGDVDSMNNIVSRYQYYLDLMGVGREEAGPHEKNIFFKKIYHF